jgi:hypothetical protein
LALWLDYGKIHLNWSKSMAFTEATLQAQIANDGLNAEVTKYVPSADGLTVDVYVQNLNTTTSRKEGWTQVAQTNTAAQAAALIRANLTS